MQGDDPDYQPKSSPSKLPQELVLKFSTKTLLKGSAELATRCKVSHRVATAMTAQFVKACSGDINECSISTSTSYRQRKAGLKVAEERIQEDFKSKDLQALMILHWDGKKIKYQKRREKDDRLAIVASFPRPTDKHQFLGAPRIPDGTGSCYLVAA